ncbi:hypothetical protein C8R45DRAFT_1139152 [Mycena sanguinolenta]|nr:hypothetical protein C8R45DRAFT_1139152 [Mycena sanguinolenta]
MPFFSPRRAHRADALLKYYIRNHKGRQRRALLRRRAVARARHTHPVDPPPTILEMDIDSPSSDSSDSDTSSDSSSSSSDGSTGSSDSASSDSGSEWSDILGPNWRFANTGIMSIDSSESSSDNTSDSTSDTTSSSPMQDMPDLFSVSSDSLDESDSEIEWNWSSGAEGDDEESDDDLDDIRRPCLRQWVQNEIDDMYAHRYEQPRDTLPRGPSYLHHVLTALKAGRADHFRQNLRVSPLTFDKLVAALEDDPVFFNNSNSPQLPVDEQVAVALYRFGHDGNAASMQAVANWGCISCGVAHEKDKVLPGPHLRANSIIGKNEQNKSMEGRI